MTQATHTPGPWAVDHAGNGSWLRDASKANGEMGRYLLTKHHPNRIADANLAAAAPDMLAALQAIINDADSSGCDGCAVISAQFIAQAEAAIAKAVQS